MKKRVAIIGGGLAGCLTALALAKRGIHSEIFERNERELLEASFFNEGKVHLGFLYAHDFSGETSKLMAQGAATFRTLIAELTGFDTKEALSTPFLYAVHRDSLVSPEDFEEHLYRCGIEFSKHVKNDLAGAGYVNGSSKVSHRRMGIDEWGNDLDPDLFSAVFHTDELGVDPRRLASEVSRAVRMSNRINLHLDTRVHKVSSSAGDEWSLADSDGILLGGGTFGVVVNSSWSDLIRIDKQANISLPRDWSYRYKLGNRILMPVNAGELDSVTVVLGAFGDIVNYGEEGGIFLSWYPSGRLLMTDEIDLPDWNGNEYRKLREAAYEKSKLSWESMSSKLRKLNISAAPVDTRGGMILAAGRLDVDDPGSPLHSRLQVGINRRGSYFSLNTGKYTLAPLLAMRVSDLAASLV